MPFHKSVDMLFRGRQDLSFDGRKVLTLEQEKNRAKRRVRGILFYIRHFEFAARSQRVRRGKEICKGRLHKEQVSPHVTRERDLQRKIAQRTGLIAHGAGKRTGANYLQISERIRHDI